MATKSKLSEWSDIIQRNADQRAAEDAERIRNLKRGLPKATRELKNKTNKELLELYRGFPSGGLWAAKEEIKIREKYIEAIEAEILARMSRRTL